MPFHPNEPNDIVHTVTFADDYPDRKTALADFMSEVELDPLLKKSDLVGIEEYPTPSGPRFKTLVEAVPYGADQF